MPASLFEAPPYDPARERRRKLLLALVAVAVVVVAVLLWWFRYWPEEHTVDKFFSALQHGQYETAYAIWQADPDWKQHPDRYKSYTYSDFYHDWGPGGDWGAIKSYHIDGTAAPTPPATGVLVVTAINQRGDRSCLWVEKRSKTLGFSQYDQVNIGTQSYTCR